MKLIIPSDVQRISSVLNNAGFQSYLVGGAVRDKLLGIDVKDYDFCSDARPEQVMGLFPKVIPTGIKHGTVSIIIRGKPYEITTFRIEGKYSDGRRPDNISYGKELSEDLKRRDFTVNSIAYDILKKEIHDPNRGIEDLEKKIIRAIGTPEERFTEDGLRSIRACRFASQLNFTIHENTIKGIKKCLFNIQNLSKERIYDELLKIMKTRKPSIAFKLFQDTGILPLILPELSLCAGVKQKGMHDYDVFEHLLYSCDSASRSNSDLRFAALFHDLGKAEAKKICKNGDITFYNHEQHSCRMAIDIMERYRFPKKKISTISHLINQHMFHYTNEWTDAAVRRFIKKAGIDHLDDLYALRKADIWGMTARKAPDDLYGLEDLKLRVDKILENDNAFCVKDLSVNGYDIMEATGIRGGPKISTILNHLLEKVLDDPDQNSKEHLLKIAKQFASTL